MKRGRCWKPREEEEKSKGKTQRANVQDGPYLDERLLEYGALVIRLVEALPGTSDFFVMEWTGQPSSAESTPPRL